MQFILCTCNGLQEFHKNTERIVNSRILLGWDVKIIIAADTVGDFSAEVMARYAKEGWESQRAGDDVAIYYLDYIDSPMRYLAEFKTKTDKLVLDWRVENIPWVSKLKALENKIKIKSRVEDDTIQPIEQRPQSKDLEQYCKDSTVSDNKNEPSYYGWLDRAKPEVENILNSWLEDTAKQLLRVIEIGGIALMDATVNNSSDTVLPLLLPWLCEQLSNKLEQLIQDGENQETRKLLETEAIGANYWDEGEKLQLGKLILIRACKKLTVISLTDISLLGPHGLSSNGLEKKIFDASEATAIEKSLSASLSLWENKIKEQRGGASAKLSKFALAAEYEDIVQTEEAKVTFGEESRNSSRNLKITLGVAEKNNKNSIIGDHARLSGKLGKLRGSGALGGLAAYIVTAGAKLELAERYFAHEQSLFELLASMDLILAITDTLLVPPDRPLDYIGQQAIEFGIPLVVMANHVIASKHELPEFGAVEAWQINKDQPRAIVDNSFTLEATPEKKLAIEDIRLRAQRIARVWS